MTKLIVSPIKQSEHQHTDTGKLRILLSHASHVEQGQERLIRDLVNDELDRVRRVRDALESIQDGGQDRASAN
jgi:hypothetical protein